MQLKVKDMFVGQVTLVQDEETVKYFNDMFGEDYAYFFVKKLRGCLDQLYGSYSTFLQNNVSYVGEVAI